MDCDTPNFIPHYYNLDLPINATQREIKQAYRRLIKKLHPDKNILPAQKQNNDVEAIYLVFEAYATLSNKEKRDKYRYDGNTLDYKWELEYWNEKWKNKHPTIDNGPKPWFWHYEPLPADGMCRAYEEGDPDYKFFCTATWVNLAHLFIDNALPERISDNIWRRAETWRDGGVNETQPRIEWLDFHRGCETIETRFWIRGEHVPWSEIPSDTDWPTLGYPCDIFCPDILIVPFATFLILFPLFIFACFKILEKLLRPPPPSFWPPSAISTPTATDPLIDDIINESQRRFHASVSRRRRSPTQSEEDYYGDEEITPQFPSEKSASTQYYSAVETQGESPTLSKKVPTQGPSTNPSSKSSPTQYYNSRKERPRSPIDPSQLLSLASSEKHWYYSDKGPAQDLPLRERRRPSVIPEPIRPRVVHYEDENYADDERTPRICIALTATGKPCQRRVSTTTPLSGSTVSGLVSPLCFQHRHIRQWIRNNSGEELPALGRPSSSGKSAGLEKRRSVGRPSSSRS